MPSFVQGIVLGIVQGITEWLPVSSEGINTLIQLHFFDEPLAEAIRVSLWLHAGTLIAAVLYFRKDITELLRHLPQYTRELKSSQATERSKLISFLVISTALTGAIGAPLLLIGLEQEEVPAGIVMAVIGGFLIITGLVQRYAPRFSGTKETTSIKDAVIVGVVQAFAAFPGLSRSGLTISALLFRGYDPQRAIKISFLMSIPVVLAAEIGLGLIDGASFDVAAICGLAAAFVFGILTIGALIKLAARVRFWKFCIVLGILSLLPLLIERL
jgi:undecaprenyl-diphosphatase